MGEIADRFADAFRDFVTSGVPASGSYQPSKAQIRSIGVFLERVIGGAVSGLSYYATKAVLETDTSKPLGTLAYVYDDPTAANNAVYHYETGGWVLDTAYYESVAAVVQPIVDEAITASNEAYTLASYTAANAPNQRDTLGDMLARADVSASPQNGATALPGGKGFEIASGANGNATFIAANALLATTDRAVLASLPGVKLRVDTEFRITGDAARLGSPSADFKTYVVRETTPVGGSENLGELDILRTAYAPGVYRRSTTVDYEPDMTRLGQLVQFAGVQAGGTVSVTLTGLTVSIESVGVGAAQGTAADLTRKILENRQALGEGLRYTVGGTAASYPTLAAASAAIAPGSIEMPQVIAFRAAIDPTKTDLPDYTSLVGVSPQLTRINFPGSATLTDATRTDFDPVRLRGNSDLRRVAVVTKNSNYALHSETANGFKNWLQRIEDCEFRHNGNEEAFANGNLSEGGRHTPAMGTGMSSGSRMEVRRTVATSFKGGGGYWHNAAAQERPCSVLLEDVTLGGDSLVDPDLIISTLGSGTLDNFDMAGVTLTNGAIGYAVSAIPTDPMRNYAAHTDFRVFGRNVSPHIFVITDPGRALRVRGKAATGFVTIGGEAAAVLFDGGSGLTRLIGADTDKFPEALGAMDVVGHSIGQRVDLLIGQRRLIVTAGGTTITYTFGSNASATSNDAHIAAINAAITSIATLDLYNPGIQYRPTIYDQEICPVNIGPVPIHQGTVVIYAGRGNTCRNAEPSDFNAGALVNPKAQIGVALEYIARGAAGRVQYQGYINSEHLMGQGTVGNVGDGFTVETLDGVHGALKYAGSGGAILKHIQGEENNGRGRYLPKTLLIA